MTLRHDRRRVVAALVGLPALQGLGTAAFAQTPRERLVVAINKSPDTLDITTTRSFQINRPVMLNVNETLVGLSTDGRLEPGLARWKLLDDRLTWEFTLLPNVKFHSGDTLTTRDVLFSHERMMTGVAYKTYARDIAGVDVVDDQVIRFRFARYNFAFVALRALAVVSKAYFDRVGEARFTAEPVGTGPYRLTAKELGRWFDLDAFEGYRGAAPAVKKARLAIVNEDTTRLAMLKAGEADICFDVPFNAVAGIRQAGFKVVSIPMQPTVTLQFHLLNPKAPWADKRVRQAIAAAIDAASLAKYLFKGLPVRYPRLAPDDLGYDASLMPYAFDPQRAKQLLAEAGYAKGFTVPLYYWGGAVNGLKETAETTSIYLKHVGIAAQVRILDSSEGAAFVRRTKKDPEAAYLLIAPIAVTEQTDPAGNVYLLMHSRAPNSLYANPELDRALDAALAASDPTQRAQATRAAMKIMHDEVPTIPLWTNTLSIASKPSYDVKATRKTFPGLLLKDVTVATT